MEQQIANILKEKLGCRQIKHIQIIPKSSFHTCYVFETDIGKFFVKTSDQNTQEMYEAEAKGLTHIDSTATFKVPEPFYYGKVKDYAILVLEYIDIKSHDQESLKKLGKLLAKMHKTRSSSSFGYDNNNFLGTTLQVNHWTKNWVEFFSQHRLFYQIRLVEKKYGDEEIVSQASEVVEVFSDFCKGVTITPSLLHGDLWSGNTAATLENEPVVFDPACYYGHHEADLSIASLFGGFSKEFYEAYHELLPKEKGFEERQQVYKLYHLLNHYVIFGDAYRQEVLSILREIL